MSGLLQRDPQTIKKILWVSLPLIYYHYQSWNILLAQREGYLLKRWGYLWHAAADSLLASWWTDQPSFLHCFCTQTCSYHLRRLLTLERPDFESKLCPLLAVWPQASDSSSLCLSALIGKQSCLSHWDVSRINLSSFLQALSTVVSTWQAPCLLLLLLLLLLLFCRAWSPVLPCGFCDLMWSLLILQLRIPYLEAWNPRLCLLCRATGKTAGSRVCESSWQAGKFCMDVSCQCWLGVSVLRSNPPPHPRSWFLASWRLDACGVLLWFPLPMGILSSCPSAESWVAVSFTCFPCLCFGRGHPINALKASPLRD